MDPIDMNMQYFDTLYPLSNHSIDMEYIENLYAGLNETISYNVMEMTEPTFLFDDLILKYEGLKNEYRTYDELENFWDGGRGSQYQAWVAIYKIAEIPKVGPLVHAALKFKREGELIDRGEVDCGWGCQGYEMCIDRREPIDTIFIGSSTEQPNSVDAFAVYQTVQEVRRDWKGKSYGMLEDNCTDFVHEVLKRLGLRNVLGMFLFNYFKTIFTCNHFFHGCYAYSRTYHQMDNNQKL